MSYQIPIWIDCDPGHDDAIAILLASNLPSWFNLVGISTVHGNAPLSKTTHNAVSLVEAFRVDENPFESPFFNKLKVSKEAAAINPPAKQPLNSTNPDSSSSISASIPSSLQNQKPSSLRPSASSTTKTNGNSSLSPSSTSSQAIPLKKNDSTISRLSALASDSTASASAAALTAEEALFRKRNLPVNVYAGSPFPLTRLETGNAIEIHGDSGLDGTSLLPAPRKKAIWNTSGIAGDPPPDYAESLKQGEETAAVAGIAAAVRRYPGEIAIVATGALTNIAEFANRYPQLIPQVRVLSVMGGGIGIGNITPFAEFNIWCDPEAAKRVLGSKITVQQDIFDPVSGKTTAVSQQVPNELARKTVLSTLNITHEAIATKEIRNYILNQGIGAPTPMHAQEVENETLAIENKALAENQAIASQILDPPDNKNESVPGQNNPVVDNSNNTPVSRSTSAAPFLPYPTTNFVRRMLYELLEYYAMTYSKQYGEKFSSGAPIHDPLAVAALLPLYFPGGGPPDLKMKYKEYAMDVITDRGPNPEDGQNHVGQTVIIGEDSEYGVRVVEAMDMDVFWSLVLESLHTLDKKILKAYEQENIEVHRQET